MLSFYSTKEPLKKVALKEAVFNGVPSDGGLYMIERIPLLDKRFLDDLSGKSFQEVSYELGRLFFKDCIPPQDLKRIIEGSLTFDAPLIELEETIYMLELFHGPTLSFKDFGARFMARLTEYLNQGERKPINVLVATSGDTGSAVAHGFLDIPGIKVWVLYPKGQVTLMQEKQLTTLGHNVKALEVDGTFDDCQTMIKSAFQDSSLKQKIRVTAANSINVARLIPQTFYYFYALSQLKTNLPVVVSVPCGNFGNLIAGLIAKKMGLGIDKFIAATNINDSIPNYFKTGQFKPAPSKHTISNAMDVGNPSNFQRLVDLYDGDIEKMQKEIFAISFTDEETKSAILELKEKYHTVSDPHGAVGYLGLKTYQKQRPVTCGIFLATAHPAKFYDVVEPILKSKIEIPERLQKIINLKKDVMPLSNSYEDLKELLLKS